MQCKFLSIPFCAGNQVYYTRVQYCTKNSVHCTVHCKVKWSATVYQKRKEENFPGNQGVLGYGTVYSKMYITKHNLMYNTVCSIMVSSVYTVHES